VHLSLLLPSVLCDQVLFPQTDCFKIYQNFYFHLPLSKLSRHTLHTSIGHKPHPPHLEVIILSIKGWEYHWLGVTLDFHLGTALKFLSKSLSLSCLSWSQLGSTLVSSGPAMLVGCTHLNHRVHSLKCTCLRVSPGSLSCSNIVD
jgi:hypothetical protein